MQTTTNYGLKTYEGTDLFNPLVVENPNTETLDTVVKAISDKAVGNATELKTGTVHALSRLNEDADRDVFTFRATSAFTAGDTFTLDGEQVSALTVAGEQLSTNCFIIGSTVLVAKRDTLLTFFVAETTAKDAEKLGGELPSYYATASALATIAGYVTALQDKVGTATLVTTAQDCSGAINELSTQITPRIINEASDGSWCLRKQGKRMILQMFGITGNNLININISAYPPHSPASTAVVTRDSTSRKFGMVYANSTGIHGYDLPAYGSGAISEFGPNYGPAVSGTLEWYID